MITKSLKAFTKDLNEYQSLEKLLDRQIIFK